MNDNSISRLPGLYERHLRRKQDNWLFPEQEQRPDAVQWQEARRRDRLALDSFQSRFRDQVEKAMRLDSRADSDVVLELKQELDACYQASFTLPGDMQPIRVAIRKLIDSIMRAVRKGAGNDSYAQQQLHDEDIARETHFRLQQNPLIADLTATDSPIKESELVPCLLGEQPDSLVQVLALFDARQADVLLQEATRFLKDKDPQQVHTQAWQNLGLIREHVQTSQAGSSNRVFP